jgi:hypothetical protein
MIKIARVRKMIQQIDYHISETISGDDCISEGDLIDFALTCRVEKDYDPVEAEWDEWWQYYIDNDETENGE